MKDAYKSQWKLVQHLADNFWERWRKEYVVQLQSRPKWLRKTVNFKEGDIVLMKDNQSPRLEWPMAVVDKTFPSEDEYVRKVQIRILREGHHVAYVRPITQLVLLLPSN